MPYHPPMCGRYSLTTPAGELADGFNLPALANLPPRYNIAPTQEAPVIRQEGGVRSISLCRWGLVPSWSDGPDSRFSMFNARAETIAEKPAFRDAFRKRRCLVPADGFYEWTGAGGAKQPYRITLEGGGPFAFAGLWEAWKGKDGTKTESFTIIVTEAAPGIRHIHDRMPVIIQPMNYPAWFDMSRPMNRLDLLRPYQGELAAYPVSKHVNNARNDDAGCIAPISVQESL
ncbi:MAG: SOS response-associated peptidase [Rhodospirillales bacterium]